MIMRALFLHNSLLENFHHPLLSLSCESIPILFSHHLLFLPSQDLTYPPMLQMVNTRNHNINKDNSQGNPPPPPPMLEQVLIMQVQMLQTMQQTMATMQNAQGNHAAQQP
jgi:hypothetical protein